MTQGKDAKQALQLLQWRHACWQHGARELRAQDDQRHGVKPLRAEGRKGMQDDAPCGPAVLQQCPWTLQQPWQTTGARLGTVSISAGPLF